MALSRFLLSACSQAIASLVSCPFLVLLVVAFVKNLLWDLALGPLFFCNYMRRVTWIIRNVNVIRRFYADDLLLNLLVDPSKIYCAVDSLSKIVFHIY